MSEASPSPGAFRLPKIPSPYFAATVLCSMNLLNYMDRYVFSAVGKQIQENLEPGSLISDDRFGYLASAFIVVYTFASPVFGWLGDRYNRLLLISSGVALWSVATVGTALAVGYYDMFFYRAVLGIGEASYGAIAPALLSDLFAPKYRGRVIGIYYLALPIGTALGYILGYLSLQQFNDNWRVAFLIVGIPGLLAAALGLLIRDPGRGSSEGHGHEKPMERPSLSSYMGFFRIPTFVFNTAGLAAVTFTTGAFGIWGAIYYQRVRPELFPGQIIGIIGIMLAGSGLLGIGLGIWISDFLLKYTRKAYLIWACVAVLLSVPLGLVALLIGNGILSLLLLFVAMTLLASTLGPCNTVTANVIPANQRAAGFAVSIFILHLLGDIPSPILVGRISTLFGQDWVIQSGIGQFFASLGVGPITYQANEKTEAITQNLTVGLLVIIPVLLLGGIFYFLGSRTLPQDQKNAGVPLVRKTKSDSESSGEAGEKSGS